ncbi:MAG: hypothetical protein H6740_24760 [Alphaproteobacteria bacterium]|nr:hypothetical protein [Alphaproteobacteria bacterium]
MKTRTALMGLSVLLMLSACRDKDGDDSNTPDDSSVTDDSHVTDDSGETTTRVTSLTARSGDAEVLSVPERSSNVELVAEWSNGAPHAHGWAQRGGPSVHLSDNGHSGASLDLSEVEVAAPAPLVFELTSTDEEGNEEVASVTLYVTPVDVEPAMGPDVQLGGATGAVTTFDHEGGRWMIYSAGNRISVTSIGMTRGADHVLHLPDYVKQLQVVEREGQRWGLAALGPAGLGVLDLNDPTAPALVDTVPLDFYQGGLTWAEGGGAILEDEEISSEQADLTCVETDGETLWLGTADYGLHRVALSAVLRAEGASREEDGTLAVDHEVYALQYAGENPWGGPEDIQLVGGRLFVAQGFLGLGIFDAMTLERVGGYNLYADASVVEDWFIDMDVAQEVSTDPETGEPFLDAVTGLPDYRQANFEIEQVWHGDVDAPTPWADFDRYARYYYVAHAVEVATQGERDIAYIAYGLGGLVAVDVTGAAAATPEAPLTAQYLGYVPGVPAHGPDEPTSGTTESLYPHYGFGKLAEAGVNGLSLRGDTVWFSDHFAGLAAVGGADDPAANWHGADGVGGYDNDDPTLGDGVLGDHWPDYEFVTSYDMSPWDPSDHESLPQFMFEAPILVVTGEVIGHGGAPLVEPGFDGNGAGSVDLIQAAGSGGLASLDITDLSAANNDDRFALVQWYPTTDELGAAADGTVSEPMSLGHTQGVSASARYLYVGDGPHGVSAWEIADADGVPVDTLRLVANTVQDEYPVTVGDVTVYPATHASNVVFDEASQSLFSLSQTVGLRRVPVSRVEAGEGVADAPILIAPTLSDIFEHNIESGNLGGLHGQDHAYDAIIEGDLAFVADGSNGLTVYDLTEDPSTGEAFVVGNIGGENTRPPLGRATGLDLWTHPDTGARYAFVAAGQRGIGVVDASDPADMSYVKVFEPIKLEDDTIGKADGRCVDIRVLGDVVWVSYSSFGLVSFSLDELIAPVPDGVDPLEIWSSSQGFDHRPEELDRLDLTDLEGFEDADYEFLYFDHVVSPDGVLLYVAAGGSGLVIVDGTDPTNIQLVEVAHTADEATAVSIANGRIYVADHGGGVAVFK